MKYGAQLFSVRDLCKTNEGLKDVVLKMKSLGYTSVQLSGFDYDATAARKILDDAQMNAGLTHISVQSLINDPDKIISDHKILGADTVGLGYPAGYTNGKTVKIEELISVISDSVKKIQDAGLTFAYHNHAMEFADMGGYRAIDVIFEKTDWNIILDAGWVNVTGTDTVKTIQWLAPRLRYVHLKDFHSYEKDGSKVNDIVPLYCGEVPFDDIIPAFIKAGTEVAYIEQDNANESPDPIACMKTSIDALKKKGWIK